MYTAALYWIVNHLDRILALAAIIIAAIAMVDVRRLFHELEERDRNTEKRVQKELLTHAASVGAFFRAAQYIDFDAGQPDKVTAIAMLISFRLQQVIAPDATPQQLAELRQNTRNTMEEKSKEYAQMIISSGIGKLKPGWSITPSR